MLNLVLVMMLVVSQSYVVAQSPTVVANAQQTSSSSSSARTSTTSQVSSSTNSSVSAFGNIASDLQAQLQRAANNAFSALSADPDQDINTVLQQLAQDLLMEIGKLFVTLFQQSSSNEGIDVAATSEEISSAVGGAISVAAASATAFADLDVDFIQAEIKSSVEDSLSGLSKDSNVTVVTTQVASGILNVIGNALAEATGQTFSFQLTVQTSTGDGSGEATLAQEATTTTSATEFEASFSSEAEKAIATLEQNPEDLATFMSQIATILSTSVQKLLVSVSTGSDIEADDFSSTISSAFNSLLNSLASSSWDYAANIDVDNITSSIQSQLQTFFSTAQSQPNINTETLTTKVVNTVITTVGEALSQATGVAFSPSIDLGDGSAPTTTASSLAIQGLSELASELQAALETAFAELENALADVDTNANKINTVLQSVGNMLITILLQIITTIIKAGDIDAQAISITITESIQKAVTAAAASSTQFKNLNVSQISAEIQTSLDTIFSEIAGIKNVDANDLTVNIANSVLASIGDAISDITDTKFSFTVSPDTVPAETASNETAVASASTGDASSHSVQLQVSADILSAFKDTDAAIKLIQDAAEKQQTIEISAAFLQAIREGQDDELTKVLTRFFTDTNITSQTVGLVLTFTINQGNKNASTLLTNAIKDTTDLSKLSDVFKFAFTTKDSNVTDAFSTLVQSSIQNKKCSLSGVIEAALKDATTAEVEQITAVIEQAGAGVCIPVQYLSTTTSTTIASTTEATTTAATSTMEATTTASTNTTEASNATFASVESASKPSSTSIIVAASSDSEPVVEAVAAQTSTSKSVNDSSFVSSSSVVASPVIVAIASFVSEPVAEAVDEQTFTSTLVNDSSSVSASSVVAAGSSSEEAAPTALSPAPVSDLETPQSDTITAEECVDVTPPGGFTCEQQYRYGKCVRKWMQDNGFCAKTCGFCVQHNCTDVAPDDRYTCAEQKEFGKCEMAWMISGNFCAATCGRCGESAPTLTLQASASPKCECSCCNCQQFDTEQITSMVQDIVSKVMADIRG